MSADAPPASRPLPRFDSHAGSRDQRRTASSFSVLVWCVFGILAVGILDYATGLALRVFPLYFLPLAYGAWWLTRALSLTLVALVTLTWLMANVFAEPEALPPSTWAFNTLAQLAAFATPAVLISELRRRLHDERFRSLHDPLTGLFNSRAFREHSLKLLPFARRQNLSVTAAYLDLDNFKAVNDQHGHEAGDFALVAVAGTLARHGRASDLIARMGGDEFVLLLFGAAPDEARAALERLRQQIGLVMRANHWPVTASIGAIHFKDAPEPDRDLMVEADALMYRAKRAGKDRVHLELAER